MNILDAVIILFAISSLLRGYKIGLVRQLGSTIGFVLGLFAGSYLANFIIDHMEGSLNKSLTSLLIVLGISLLFMTVGEVLGIRLKQRLQNHSLDNIDGGLGSVISIITLLFGVWLAGAILALSPSSGFQQMVKNSQIISALNHELPPATSLLSTLNKLIDPNGFPQVFTGREPSPTTPAKLPSLGSFDTIVAQTRASVIRVEGIGCGGVVEGSGFIYTADKVVTNAHVVAGVRSPKVIDDNGTHNTRVVWFDDKLDLAVLQVGNLAGKPLPINLDTQPVGTPGVVLGYPGGGSFDAQTASIIDRFSALGRSIYGKGTTVREVYSLQAKVVPGNSGGPLIGADGSVLGIIFATSTSYSDVGYALTSQQASTTLTAAQNSTVAYSTGACSE